MNNAAAASGASKVTIALNRNDAALRLTVADDGRGMASPPSHRSGMGLYSMSYRATALGGTLKIDSKPGEGMIVSCEILHANPELEVRPYE